MPFLLLSDTVVVIHLSFVIFVVAGGLLVFRWRWIIWLHLPAVLWGALVEFSHWICPLTYLEGWLRGLAGSAAYRGDFVAHYLMPVLYPTHFTAQFQIFLGGLVIFINICIYGAWLFYPRR